jgi:hypothetical protein
MTEVGAMEREGTRKRQVLWGNFAKSAVDRYAGDRARRGWFCENRMKALPVADFADVFSPGRLRVTTFVEASRRDE